MAEVAYAIIVRVWATGKISALCYGVGVSVTHIHLLQHQLCPVLPLRGQDLNVLVQMVMISSLSLLMLQLLLVGSEERVPIKILRDTGTKNSFILESVLPVFACNRNEGFHSDVWHGDGFDTCTAA